MGTLKTPIKITLTGNVPPKKNSKRIFCRNGRPVVLPSKAYEQWALNAHKGLNFGRTGVQLPLDEVKVTLSFWWQSKRKKDLTNTAESVMDFLVDEGILKDDSWDVVNYLLLKSLGVDKNNCRTEILIENTDLK